MPRIVKTTESPKASPLFYLSPQEVLFLNEYLANGGNRVKAYQKVYPASKYGTANTQGYRLMQKPTLQAEIARRLQQDVKITREWGERNLLLICEKAIEKEDHDLLRQTTMDAMKLSGFLIEKRQELEPELDHVTSEKIWNELSKRVTPGATEKMSEKMSSVKSDAGTEESSKIP